MIENPLILAKNVLQKVAQKKDLALADLEYVASVSITHIFAIKGKIQTLVGPNSEVLDAYVIEQFITKRIFAAISQKLRGRGLSVVCSPAIDRQINFGQF